MKLSAEDAFRLYGDRVFSAAFSVTGNQADADDAVQDTYLRYCSYDKEFTDEDHIRAWLLRVAINRARDQKRSFWEKHRVSWEDYMETLVFEAPEDKSLFEAVMSLPAKYRTVIHLFYYDVLLRGLQCRPDRGDSPLAGRHRQKPAEPGTAAPENQTHGGVER